MKPWKLAVLTLLLYKPAGPANLPVSFLSSADGTKPLVFYISGDGGQNSFSTALEHQLNQQGFPVVALDARSYFWKRKTPAQTAQEIIALLGEYSALWRQSGLIFLGYSFGADVVPFVQTALPQDVLQRLRHTLLLSPSERTDFEVHVLDGWPLHSLSYSVMAEINKLTQPVTLLFGADEERGYTTALNLRKVKVITLAGNHHYNNNVAALTKQLLTCMGF